MTDLSAIALVIALGAADLALVLVVHARLRITNDARDEHAETLGVGSDSFPHEREYR